MAFQVQAICRDYGIICIHREGKDIEKIIAADDIVCEKRVCQLMIFLMLVCYWYIFTSMNRETFGGMILSFLVYLNCAATSTND